MSMHDPACPMAGRFSHKPTQAYSAWFKTNRRRAFLYVKRNARPREMKKI